MVVVYGLPPAVSLHLEPNASAFECRGLGFGECGCGLASSD